MDAFTPLYHEGGLFFLPGEYFSYIADKSKIRERGWGWRFRDIIQIFFPRFRFFFIFIQICLSWRVAGLNKPIRDEILPFAMRSKAS